MRFNTHNNKVCGYMPDTVDITFIWYSENNSFYLSDRVYIFNCTHEYFNPYTLYWMFKYRTFCNRNLRHYLN